MLNKSIKQDVRIGSIQYQFPFGLRVVNVEIGRVLKVKNMRMQFDLHSLAMRRASLSYLDVDSPVIFIDEKTRVSEIVNKESSEMQGQEVDSAIKKITKKMMPLTSVIVRRFNVANGVIKYLSVGVEQKVLFRIDKVDFKLKDIVFPIVSSKVPFYFEGIFVKEESPFTNSRVNVSGVTDIFERKLYADVDVLDASGKIGLVSNMTIENDDVNVSGNVKMGKFLSYLGGTPEGNTFSVSKMLLPKGQENPDIGIDFSFKTNMYDFKVKNVSFEGNIIVD